MVSLVLMVIHLFLLLGPSLDNAACCPETLRVLDETGRQLRLARPAKQHA
jgi:hypothetical protein